MALDIDRAVGPMPEIDPSDARRAVRVVAGHLGADCRDVLEALGLVPYDGHATRWGKSKAKRVRREGAGT